MSSLPTAQPVGPRGTPAPETPPREPSGWRRSAAWLPIPAALLLMAVLYIADLPGVYPLPYALMALNFVFLTLVSALIAYLLAQAFLVRGTSALLALGGGVLIWGASAAAAVMSVGDANLMITIHNTGAMVAAACHLAGAFLCLRPRRGARASGALLALVYGTALSTVVVVTAFAWEGLSPKFFIQGQGGTHVRQAVLGASVLMFLVSALLLYQTGQRTGSAFLRWYGLALGLLAAGLLGIMGQRMADSLLNWTSRAIQYLGGVYMLIAALVSVRESCALKRPLELALQESEERYKALAAATFEGIAVTEAGRIIDANDQLLEMLGYTRAELIGMDVATLVAPEDKERVLVNVREGRHSRLEHEVICKGGRRIAVEAHGRTVQYQGYPVRFTAIRDITERKRIEERLKNSERLYRAIGESIDYGVWVCAPDGRNIYASESFLRLVGITQQECSDFGWGAVLHPEDAERTIAAWKECVRTGGRWDIEHRFRGVDGQWHDILARGVPVRDERGKVVCWAGINLDISSLKQAQNALRQSEERYRSLFDNMTEGFAIHEIICDDEGKPRDYRFLAINAAFEQLTGLKRGEVEGKTLRQVLSEDPTEWVSIYGQVALTGQPVRFEKYSPALKRHYEIFAYRPAPRQFAVIFMDITQRKETEQELRRVQEKLKQYAEDLEKTVTRRTAKLHETIAELEHFSYAIAHDLRAPLRAMQSFAEMIQEDSPEEDPALKREYLRRIKIAASRMDQLITDSLNYSKAARQELPVEPVELGPLLQGLLDTYPNLQSDKADIQIADDLPLVLGNEAALTQCFSNLLGNAVKFARPGTRPRIRIWAERTDRPPSAKSGWDTGAGIAGWVRVWVEDDGVGIPKEAQERIFGIFQRATNSREGTGIGLAIVRKVARRMGGEVGVESEEGKGSRFWVQLPKAP